MNKKITGLTPLTDIDDNDLIPIVDVSDTTQGSNGSTRKITAGLVARKPYVTVGPTYADYITDGVADENEIAASVTANVGLFIKAGTYNIASASIAINSSNMVIQGAGQSATTIKASTSFTGGLFTLNGQNPVLQNITFKDMTFDCNNQANVEAVIIKGGSLAGGNSVDHIRFINCDFKNLASIDQGLIRIYSGYSSPSTNRGAVTDVVAENCRFYETAKFHIYVTGTSVEGLKFIRCKFLNSQAGCIAFSQSPRILSTAPNATYRGNKNWEVTQCYFYNNNIGGIAGGNAIHDVQRTGVSSFNIHDNFFDGHVTTTEQYCINVHSSWNLQITNNTFWKTRTIMAIGASNNGSYGQPNPDYMAKIQGNTFYKCYNTHDHDASIFASWVDNRWIEMDLTPLSGFARHFPSKYINNFIYNPNANVPGGSSDYSYAAIVCNPDGLEYSNNTIIDDRLLTDPSTAPTLSQVTGGSLGARTYYVQYTYSNDTGETIASTEASLAVSANKLLKMTHPLAVATYYPPFGAKYVNWYISTSSGSETLQGSSPTSWQWETETEAGYILPAAALNWTEPTTGLVVGAALPGANTTNAITTYGIYELSGVNSLPNIYENNKFYGITTEIFKVSAAYRIQRNNFTNRTFASTAAQLLEAMPYAQSNVTATTTFNVGNSEIITATLTGDITVTLSNGHYVGQMLKLILTQDSTGNRVVTWPSNFKKAGGALTLTTTASKSDHILMQWDGTNWNEISRNLNLS